MKGDLVGLDTPVMEADAQQPVKRYVDESDARWHAFAFLSFTVASVGLLALLFAIAPCAVPEKETCAGAACKEAGNGALVLLLIAVVSGLVGGLIHAVTSFTDFAGNRQLLSSWIPWLYLRGPVGSMIAVLTYFVIRTTKDLGAQPCDAMYTVALSGGLAGLFSKQVSDKLSDLVDNIFVPAQPVVRKDELDTTHTATETAADGSGTPPATTATFDETIQKAQRLLIELGFLPKVTDGKATDDGILDDGTIAGVDAFLAAQGIAGDDRKNTVGDEHDPDFWPRLLELLRLARAKRDEPGQ